MHAEQILKALATLDVKNDAHWTMDGAPKIDVLKLVAVTRDHIKKVAPGFCRANPTLPDIEDEQDTARKAREKADALRAEAEEAEVEARMAHDRVQSHIVEIKDAHTLTRQNLAWNACMNRVQMDRARNEDAVLGRIAAGGGQVGKHPIEVNEAARIRSKRKNIVIPSKV